MKMPRKIDKMAINPIAHRLSTNEPALFRRCLPKKEDEETTIGEEDEDEDEDEDDSFLAIRSDMLRAAMQLISMHELIHSSAFA